MGCGEGQAAVFFAKNGYTVSAFDVAQSGFDVIYASGVLQYISEDKRQKTIDNLKKHTNADGIHILNVFVEKPFIETAPDWKDTEYFWQSGELLQF